MANLRQKGVRLHLQQRIDRDITEQLEHFMSQDEHTFKKQLTARESRERLSGLARSQTGLFSMGQASGGGSSRYFSGHKA